MRLKVICVCVATIAMLPLSGAGLAQADDEGRGDGAALIAQAVEMEQLFVHLYNERRFDELGAAYYAEDAIAVPPNHEPIRGRAAIVAYFRANRDGLGEATLGSPLRGSASGDQVSLVGQVSAHGGQLRVSTHELYERQPDGSLRCTVDMFGFRGPLG